MKSSSPRLKFPLGKLRVLSGSEACEILEGRGFVAVRQRGSHRIMQLRTEETTVTCPSLSTIPLDAALYRASLANLVWTSRYLNAISL